MRPQLVVLAGGKGTRLKPLTGDLPKPLVDIAGKPLLEHQLCLAKGQGFDRFLFLTHYQSERIMEAFGDGSRWGVQIQYHKETSPLGTAGAVLDAWDKLEDHFIVLYGDTYIQVDLNRFWSFHQSRGCGATLFLHPNDHPYDSDIIEVDDKGFVSAIHPYPHGPEKDLPNLVNAALYAIEKESLEKWRAKQKPAPFDFAKHLFPQALASGVKLGGYLSAEFIKDIGTPDRHQSVLKKITDPRWQNSARRPAVLFDRDGTLTRQTDYVTHPDQIQLMEGAGPALRALNQAGYLTALITNQPVIARGDCSLETLNQIHNRLQTLLGKERAYLDRLYFCPHHPDKGFPGERPEYKIPCQCRKPGTGLIEQAGKDLNLDLGNCWFVGDSTVDLEAARRANIRSVLIKQGVAGKDGRHPVYADYEFHTLAEAVQFILEGYQGLQSRLKGLIADIRRSDRVVVAGPAHSGKSTFASALRDGLRQKGISAAIVRLDGWLRSREERPGSQLSDAYDLPQLEVFFRELFKHKTGTHRLPFYDRYRQRQVAQCVDLHVRADDVLIIEGVVGFLVEPLRQANLRIFLEEKEGTRFERFLRYHQWRETASDAPGLFRHLETHETPVVLDSQTFANVVIPPLNSGDRL